ncbi:MAG: LTA synthase family protein [Bdellovibrionales bacterium]
MFVLYKDPSVSNYSDYYLSSFLIGLRMDVAVACFVLALPAAILIPAYLLKLNSLWKAMHIFLRGYYTVMLSLVFILWVSNIIFYSYFQEHFNLLVFGLLEDDTWALMKTLWKTEPLLLQLGSFCLAIFGIYKFVDKVLFNVRLIRFPFTIGLQRLGLMLVVFGVTFGAQGNFSLTKSSLHPSFSQVSPNFFLNKVSFNAIYAIADAFRLRYQVNRPEFSFMEANGYGNLRSKALKDFKVLSKKGSTSNVDFELLRISSDKSGAKPPNVLVIVVESWGTYWMNYQSKEFPILSGMEKHFKDGVLFKNFLPSGNGTYASVTNLLLNSSEIPGLRSAEIFLDRELPNSAVKPFNESGYDTNYIYGGRLSWRNMQPFLYHIGFSSIYGETDILEFSPNVDTHDWGVHDRDLYRYVLNRMEGKAESNSPTMYFALTTSNHAPFEVPKKFDSKLKALPQNLKSKVRSHSDTVLARLRSYEYSMNSLSEFLDDFKRSPLHENTIVAITGDHGFYEGVEFPLEKFMDWKGVPLFLYFKGQKIDVNPKVFGSHDDIFPTIYEMALDRQSYLSYGNNLLDPDLPKVASHPDATMTAEQAWVKGLYFKYDQNLDSYRRLIRVEDSDREIGLFRKSYHSIVDEIYRTTEPKNN